LPHCGVKKINDDYSAPLQMSSKKEVRSKQPKYSTTEWLPCVSHSLWAITEELGNFFHQHISFQIYEAVPS
jgi:hypothetical protein